jgi:predicted PurR-regulated permease PerM
MNEHLNDESLSPRWPSGTKLVVSLTLAAILIVLVMRFRNIIGPLLITFILAYLIYPIATRLTRKLRLKWQVTVTLLYLLLILILIGLLTWGGVALAQQIQSLISFIEKSLVLLPDFLNSISTKVIEIGTLKIDLSQYGLSNLGNQILNAIQPLLGKMGSLVGLIAGGAAEVVGWLFFVLLVSYFILVESGGISGRIFNVNLPGITADLRRMSAELGRIWNAFVRGQFLIILLTFLVYAILLSILGVRYTLGLALLAGFARFVPYVGPGIAWTTFGLVSYFQSSHPFGINPLIYTIIVVGVSLLTDILLDNLVATRILARALKIHPAAVLVAALILANLIGFIGIVLASPVVATLKLFLRYTVRKLFDLDPWEGLEEEETPRPQSPLVLWLGRIWDTIYRRGKIIFQKK